MKSLLLQTQTDRLIGRLLAIGIVLVLALVPPASANAATSPDGWATQTSGTPSTLYGIWGASFADVFAAGDAGTMLHYNGSAWSTMTTNTTGSLYGVWGSSSSDVFAVGQNGVVCHYDGVGWSEVDSGTNRHLQGVWGTDNEDVFAVGYQGTILHYDGIDDDSDGSTWDNMTSNTNSHLKCIWGNSSSDVFAAGNNGVVVHYDGVAWSVVLANSHPNFQGIWGSASDNVFAVGGGGMILHYDGVTWDNMTSGVTSELDGVWGVSPADVFVVGLDGVILHYDGNAWGTMDSGVTDSLYSIYGFSSLNVFAAGYNGTTLHYKELTPDVSAVSPNQGNQGQTLDVTITGSNLDTATSVSFGSGVSVNSYVPNSATQITANITIGAAIPTGARDVSVTTPYGTDTLSGAFTIPSASMSGISPDQGDQGETQEVTISGNNLARAMGVTLGSGVTVNSFSVQSPTQVVVNITIGVGAASGARDVSVITPESTASLPGGYWVGSQPPAITSVSPSSGKLGQTLDVAIAGADLGGTTAIAFGGGITVNSFTVQSPESLAASITISVSASVGARNVTVTTIDGIAILTNGFSVTAEPPAISEVSPLSGKVGQAVILTITGANLDNASSVNMGPGIDVEGFEVSSPDLMTVSIIISWDASVGARDISVTTPGGTATLADGFIVYRLLPGVTGVNPASGESGETLYVVISGANFIGAYAVSFGPGIRVNSFTVDSDTQITVNITILDDAESGLRDVQITTAAGSGSFPSAFDLDVGSPEESPLGPSPKGSSAAWWVPLLSAGIVAVIVAALWFAIRKRVSSTKAQ